MREKNSARAGVASRRQRLRVQLIEVERIRPEDGLGRKRDREGHRELCRSIEQFGVLTPITVRPTPGDGDEYLLIKGQGRTLACRVLGIAKIPAVVVDAAFADTEKVQQFLVENVARLRMSPVDRALLITHARRSGEETAAVAARFGVASATVRRLEAQLDGASSGEVLALRAGQLSLSVHAVIIRHVAVDEREAVISAISGTGVRSTELDALMVAVGWTKLTALGLRHRERRLQLLSWSCARLATLPRSSISHRLAQLAAELPPSLPSGQASAVGG